MTKTFVLGLGAQKAGSTWIAEYLRQSNGYRTGPLGIKEYGVWSYGDNLFKGSSRRPLLPIRGKGGNVALALMDRYKMLYFMNFSFVLRHGGIAADITPEYAGLSIERLAYIRDRFHEKGVKVKIVFSIRDPISRIISSFNMFRSRIDNGQLSSPPWMDDPLDIAFRRFYMSKICQTRTNYHITIKNIEAVFPPDMFRIMLFEEMFEPDEIVSFSDWLGVRYNTARGRQKSNAAKLNSPISRNAKRDCVQFYSDCYTNMERMIPKVRDVWNGYDYL